MRRPFSSRYGNSSWSDFGPYVSVAERRAIAATAMEKRKKKGLPVEPAVCAKGRSMATSVWGKQWCAGLESQSAFASRIDRGKTYARNGSVVHLEIRKCVITAIVSGSSLYEISIAVSAINQPRWQKLKDACAGSVGSMLDLLSGKVSEGVMSALAASGQGLIPTRAECSWKCSCPDSASLCKHIAATLYCVAARLDTRPELLFTLRDVDLKELVSAAGTAVARAPVAAHAIASDTTSLSEMFGIELDTDETVTKVDASKPVKKAKVAVAKSYATAVKTAKKSTTKTKLTPSPLKDAFTLKEAQAVGYTIKQLATLVRSKKLEKLSDGTYRFAPAK
jgi:uncharacterized Zn finger protein